MKSTSHSKFITSFLVIFLILMTNSLADNTTTSESCAAMFLEESVCQGDALMKEFQKTNCDTTFALYMPCDSGCSDGQCIDTNSTTEDSIDGNTSVLYSTENYSLSNTFMDYNPEWITDGTYDDRIRVDDGDSLSSFIFTLRSQIEISIPIKNGCYIIHSYHGDSSYAQGPHYFEVEGEVINQYEFNEKGEFIDFETESCVDDGELSLILGSSTAYLEQEFDFHNEIGNSMLNALAIGIKSDNPKMYYINFGESFNYDSDKEFFLVEGLINNFEDDFIEPDELPETENEAEIISEDSLANEVLVESVSTELESQDTPIDIADDEAIDEMSDDFSFFDFIILLLLGYGIYRIYRYNEKNKGSETNNIAQKLNLEFKSIKKDNDLLIKEQNKVLSELEKTKKEDFSREQINILDEIQTKNSKLNIELGLIEKEIKEKEDIYSKRLTERINLEKEINLLNIKTLELNKEKIKKEIIAEEKKKEIEKIKKLYKKSVQKAKETYSGEELNFELDGLKEDYEESKEIIRNSIKESVDKINETKKEISSINKVRVQRKNKSIDEIILDQKDNKNLLSSKKIIPKISAKSYKQFVEQFEGRFKHCESWPEYVDVYISIFGRNKENLVDLIHFLAIKTGVDNEEFVSTKINAQYEKAIKKQSISFISNLKEIDSMSGEGFEEYLENLFEKLEYNVFKTKRSRDGGVDLILKKDGDISLIQAKRYQLSSTVGVSAVRDVYSKKDKYKASHLIVLTTSMKFSVDARQEARENGVHLWGRDKLKELLKKAKQND